MPAITSKHELIMEYLRLTTLPVIDGTNNYNNNIKLVTRRNLLKRKLSMDQLPMIILQADLQTTYYPMTANEVVTGSIENITDGKYVGILGIAEVDGNTDDADEGKLDEVANSLHSDILIAMYRDISLGGNCEAVSIIASRPSLDLSGKGIASIYQVWSINFRFSPAADPPVT